MPENSRLFQWQNEDSTGGFGKTFEHARQECAVTWPVTRRTFASLRSVSSEDARPADDDRALARSIAIFSSIRKRSRYDRKRGLFGSRRVLLRRSYEHLWPFADAWSASCTLARVAPERVGSAALTSFLDGLAAYHPLGADLYREEGAVGFESAVVPPLGRGGDVFFDDNAWLGLAALAHHDLDSDPRTLRIAARILEFVLSGWSTGPSFTNPGGIRWKVGASNMSRNTCSNAPVCELAALIHDRTGDEEALGWSMRIYEWVRGSLLGSDSLYFDRIDPAGVAERTVWSYNQGTMIGAGVLLFGATGQEKYRRHAFATASAALSRFDVQTLLAQEAAFNAVFFRNLFLLDEFAWESGTRRLAASYADALWEKLRLARSGVQRHAVPKLNDAAALIEIYALLAGALPHP